MKTHYQSQFKTAEEAAELAFGLLDGKFSGGATQAMIKSELEATGHKVADRKIVDGLGLLMKSGRIGSRRGRLSIGLATVFQVKRQAMKASKKVSAAS